MRKAILLFVLLTLFGIPYLLAQGGFRITGQILSAEDNLPVIGVSVVEKGTTNGVITDIDGNYSITVSKSPATLQFSYVGMKTVEKLFTAATRYNVIMQPNTEMVDEVVVVAYGVRKKGTIAGSVSTVKAEKMENVPAAGFDQALQGQTPGLSVISNSGEPSKAAVFQIRGTNSINSGTSPLFILDGVPIASSDFNAISPGDIESISVLKDASSTSIYGARAANGVVVITTKRGLSIDKAKVTLRAQYGFSQLASDGKWTMMNTPERIQFEKEIGLDTGQDYELLSRTNVNWLKEIFNDRAPLQNYELSVNRATERLNYYVSGGFYDQDGIAQNSSFRRYNMRANAEVKASNWLKRRHGDLYADSRLALHAPLLEPVQQRRFAGIREQRHMDGHGTEPHRMDGKQPGKLQEIQSTLHRIRRHHPDTEPDRTHTVRRGLLALHHFHAVVPKLCHQQRAGYRRTQLGGCAEAERDGHRQLSLGTERRPLFQLHAGARGHGLPVQRFPSGNERTVQRPPYEHQLRYARLFLGRHHQCILLPLVLPSRRI